MERLLKTNRQKHGRHPTGRLIFSSLLSGLLIAAGCKSFGPSEWVTPQVTGRVLAADTRQPLAGVQVSRVLPGQGAPATPPNGAQLLQQSRPEITGSDGRFAVPGQAYATLFRHASWWSVRLAFQAPGYALYQTNFTTANVTNSAATGAPKINAGDVYLQPKPD
jgi:hypothetical protein